MQTIATMCYPQCWQCSVPPNTSIPVSNGQWHHPILSTLSKPANQILVLHQAFNILLSLHGIPPSVLLQACLWTPLIWVSWLISGSFRLNHHWTLVLPPWPVGFKSPVHGHLYCGGKLWKFYSSSVYSSSENLFHYNQLYFMDFAMLFWNGLTSDICQQWVSVHHPYTPPAWPQGKVESNQQADTPWQWWSSLIWVTAWHCEDAGECGLWNAMAVDCHIHL
jgi:hypothetical protein